MTESINALINVIVENFWEIFIIIVFLSLKRYRLGGVLLLLFRCIGGQFWWGHFVSIMAITFFTNWLDPDYISEKNDPRCKKKVESDVNNIPPPPPAAQNTPIRKDPDYTSKG